MGFSRNQIHDMVIECLCKSLGGKHATVQIDDDTDPIKELGLESLDGLAFACFLSEKLPCQIPADVNPLVNDKKKQARKVGEIVELMHNLILTYEEGKNA